MTEETIPHFGASLMAGVMLSFVPYRITERFIKIIARKFAKLYPQLRQRLSEADGKLFVFIMPDMPFHISLYIDKGNPLLSIARKLSPIIADVTITGTSTTLVSLLEGRTDGDALFFSRNLRVEGDTEALLVLRNAIDNEHIDIRRIIFSVFGPFSSTVVYAAAPIEKLSLRLARDIDRLYKAAISPMQNKQRRFAKSLESIEKRLDRMEAQTAKAQARKA